MLSTFIVGDSPDEALFNQHVGDLIERTIGGRTRTIVRAYGEMVDLLWRDGQTTAAIRLEILWNKLALSHGFALLCGYSMGGFYKQAQLFQQVCRQHDHVVDPEPNVLTFDPTHAAKSA
jgi:hypothetical protein